MILPQCVNQNFEKMLPRPFGPRFLPGEEPGESQSPKLSSPEPPEDPSEEDFRLAFLLRPKSPKVMVGPPPLATPKLLNGL